MVVFFINRIKIKIKIYVSQDWNPLVAPQITHEKAYAVLECQKELVSHQWILCTLRYLDKNISEMFVCLSH